MAVKRMIRSITVLVVLGVLASTAACGVSRPATEGADTFATIGGGTDNVAGSYATVCGGRGNAASVHHATVCGGFDNTASREATVVGGGERNRADAVFATVGGGYSNTGSGRAATVSGGAGNAADGKLAAVGGGFRNTASGWASTVSGGRHNAAGGLYPTIGGGTENTTAGLASTVSGGSGNSASANHATTSGGLSNHATGLYGTVSGGYSNTGAGSHSTVPGGALNEAGGDYSFASGQRARVDASHEGAFLYADASAADFHSAAPNEFAVRATGGVRLVTAIDANGTPIAAVALAPGSGSWSSLSDRDGRENVSPVDGSQILVLLTELPISTWSYSGQDPSIQHIGPMAQDFHALFGVGEDDTRISVVDADGVALAAIQGLYQLMLEKDAQIAALEARVAALERAGRVDD